MVVGGPALTIAPGCVGGNAPQVVEHGAALVVLDLVQQGVRALEMAGRGHRVMDHLRLDRERQRRRRAERHLDVAGRMPGEAGLPGLQAMPAQGVGVHMRLGALQVHGPVAVAGLAVGQRDRSPGRAANLDPRPPGRHRVELTHAHARLGRSHRGRLERASHLDWRHRRRGQVLGRRCLHRRRRPPGRGKARFGPSGLDLACVVVLAEVQIIGQRPVGQLPSLTTRAVEPSR